MNSTERLVWIDCEMTGLDPTVDELVEIAVIVTDAELEIVDPGLDLVIRPSEAAVASMDDFVRQMHTDSGLIDAFDTGMSLLDAEEQVLTYLQTHVPGAQRVPLAGNSIGTDRAFIRRYLPRIDEALHYRNVDVSTIKELAKRWFPRVYFHAPEKNGGHRALADIRESIRELRYYRQAMFVADPGPASAELQQLAVEVCTEFGREVV